MFCYFRTEIFNFRLWHLTISWSFRQKFHLTINFTLFTLASDTMSFGNWFVFIVPDFYFIDICQLVCHRFNLFTLFSLFIFEVLWFFWSEECSRQFIVILVCWCYFWRRLKKTIFTEGKRRNVEELAFRSLCCRGKMFSTFVFLGRILFVLWTMNWLLPVIHLIDR